VKEDDELEADEMDFVEKSLEIEGILGMATRVESGVECIGELVSSEGIPREFLEFGCQQSKCKLRLSG
jgi:hypothetical protein